MQVHRSKTAVDVRTALSKEQHRIGLANRLHVCLRSGIEAYVQIETNWENTYRYGRVNSYTWETSFNSHAAPLRLCVRRSFSTKSTKVEWHPTVSDRMVPLQYLWWALLKVATVDGSIVNIVMFGCSLCCPHNFIFFHSHIVRGSVGSWIIISFRVSSRATQDRI